MPGPLAAYAVVALGGAVRAVLINSPAGKKLIQEGAKILKNNLNKESAKTFISKLKRDIQRKDAAELKSFKNEFGDVVKRKTKNKKDTYVEKEKTQARIKKQKEEEKAIKRRKELEKNPDAYKYKPPSNFKLNKKRKTANEQARIEKNLKKYEGKVSKLKQAENVVKQKNTPPSKKGMILPRKKEQYTLKSKGGKVYSNLVRKPKSL